MASVVPPGAGAFNSTGEGDGEGDAEAEAVAGARVGGAMRASTASTSAFAGLFLVPTSVTVRDGS